VSFQQHTPAVDVAVVGGGVIGLAIAWRASRAGLSVVLFERDAPGAGASHFAAGMLAPVAEAEYGAAGRRGLELGLAAARMWPDFAAELGDAAEAEVGLRRTGTLVVARDRDEAEALEREIRFRASLGLRVTRLRPSQAREREPALAPTMRLALEAPDDHSVDPRRVVTALARAAERAGARLCPHVTVTRLCLDGAGERVTGIELDDSDRVSAGQVVVAAGAWTALLGGVPASSRLPIRPVKGQILRLRDPAGPGLIDRVVRFPGGYLVPRGDGRYVLGGTMEERGFDTSATIGGVRELLRDAHELVPGVDELVIEELGAGLRPGSPDNVPAIGPGRLGGLVWATGHHRNGILLAPLTAELALGALMGEPPSALARACAPARLMPPAGALA
jgi:glycine oxidase